MHKKVANIIQGFHQFLYRGMTVDMSLHSGKETTWGKSGIQASKIMSIKPGNSCSLFFLIQEVEIINEFISW